MSLDFLPSPLFGLYYCYYCTQHLRSIVRFMKDAKKWKWRFSSFAAKCCRLLQTAAATYCVQPTLCTVNTLFKFLVIAETCLQSACCPTTGRALGISDWCCQYRVLELYGFRAWGLVGLRAFGLEGLVIDYL